MIFRIFLNRMIFTLCGVPVAFACTGFVLMPLYQKPLNQLTAFEMSLTGTNEETYQLAINHDYIGFAIRRMMAGIPSAIGGGLAVSGVDVARHKQKKKELEDKN
jgi:hypothetical protein